MKMDKGELARIAYWALFIVTPTAISIYLWGIVVCLPVFFVLVLVGEHAFRLWKKLWKVD
jgi:hypothetical protein